MRDCEMLFCRSGYYYAKAASQPGFGQYPPARG